MKKYQNQIKSLPVLILAALLAQAASAAVPPLITQMRESVVTIYGTDHEGNMSMGTGWMISDSRVVTCFHVIDGMQRLEAMDSEHRKIPVTGVAVADKQGDIAILIIPPQPNIAPLVLAAGPPTTGERVYVLSTPHGLDSSLGQEAISSSRQVEGVNSVHTPISVGEVSAVKRADGISVVQFNAPITHGCSGSPLVNARGEVVAVVQSMSGQGEYYGVEISRVRFDQNGQAQPQTQPRANLPGPGSTTDGIFERSKGPNGQRPLPNSRIENRPRPDTRPRPQTTRPQPQTTRPQPNTRPQPRPADNGSIYESK